MAGLADDDVVIAGAVRTPFAAVGGALRRASAAELGAWVVRELCETSGVTPADVDAIVFGQVVVAHGSTNVAREIAIHGGLRPEVDSHSVSRGAATGTQALATAARMIRTGEARVVVAGGAEAIRDAPVRMSPALSDALLESARTKNPLDKIRRFTSLSARDLVPVLPTPLDPVSLRALGEGAERVAQRLRIPRTDQDALARQSLRLARATPTPPEVCTVYLAPGYEPIAADELPPAERDAEIEQAPPSFDPRFGTVTARNSAPLADGAAAILLARADVARALGLDLWARVAAVAFTGVDPVDAPLLGGARALASVLDVAHAAPDALATVEVLEGTAAEVLGLVHDFATRTGHRLPDDKLSLEGGALAHGHPFAASALRQAMAVARRLRQTGGRGVAVQSAGGGVGAALLLEAI